MLVASMLHAVPLTATGLNYPPVEKQAALTGITQLQVQKTFLEQHRNMNYLIARENHNVRDQLRILLNVLGIGPDSAFCLLGELVDINYFASSKKLVKWTGQAPRMHQSGHRKHVTSRI